MGLSAAFAKRGWGFGDLTELSQTRDCTQIFVQNIQGYLDPKEPTFLGFLIMISLYES